MDPEQLLQFAQAALQRGADSAAVNARIAEVTGGKFADLAALQQAARAPVDPAESRGAGGSWGQGSTSPIPGVDLRPMRKMEQAVFPFADEVRAAMSALGAALPGGRSPGEAFRSTMHREAADLRDLQREQPTASAAATAAGTGASLLLPAGVAGHMVRRGAGLLGTAGAGAATGGLLGGLFGAGEAEGGIAERAEAAILPAAVGAGLGGLLGGGAGAANAATRGAAGRGHRVGEALQETTGLRADPNSALDAAEAQINAARTQFYRPLEQAFPEVNSPEVVNLLRSRSLRRQTSAIAPDVADGTRAPSFEEAQRVLIRLRRLNGKDQRFKEQIEQLDDALERAVPGYAEADAAYRAAVAPQRALLDGRRFWNKPAADIQRAERGMSPDELREFRRGRIFETVIRLERRDEAAGAALKNMVDAGPEMQRVMRSLFDSEEAYQQFREVLQREQSAEKIAAALKRLAPWFAAGVGAGIGIEGAAGLLR